MEAARNFVLPEVTSMCSVLNNTESLLSSIIKVYGASKTSERDPTMFVKKQYFAGCRIMKEARRGVLREFHQILKWLES